MEVLMVLDTPVSLAHRQTDYNVLSYNNKNNEEHYNVVLLYRKIQKITMWQN